MVGGDAPPAPALTLPLAPPHLTTPTPNPYSHPNFLPYSQAYSLPYSHPYPLPYPYPTPNFLQGVPSALRGQLWRVAIGDRLQLGPTAFAKHVAAATEADTHEAQRGCEAQLYPYPDPYPYPYPDPDPLT